ncbi:MULTISPECIES: hypothetical protein [unclassified Pseudomonas]|uniref:hypothetical protein n=1 Tax=unclassified Pseudomonas TaxID=196821 RepID=UPI001AE92AB2|nr:MULTISPECIES: hypothetical protein [unclassified Pseudomonas]HDS1695770.1 hypothetical protein [Pseudomonas putida]MBP2270805.1 hypothetical protein [Pseudomonas sp. BP6]MBP2284912.1 hypothetical protein [Pseudomonas sp. BP7]MBP2290190.1 hypothetical protein [Pseudomonas sp. BP7]HDS1700992.1 hypothetical protein [Pseudomonas putida]
MSVKMVVESHIRTARICRERYSTMSQVDWLVGGVLHSLKHSMDVTKARPLFIQEARTYVQELENAGQHDAAVKVAAWLEEQRA